MIRVLACLLLFAALPAAAATGDVTRYFGQVPLLPLPDGDQPDIDELISKHWPAYWRAPGELGFGREEIRAGRFDLDQDGEAELFVLIDAPAWRKEKGQPLLVARWIGKRWVPVGWSWGDTDSVFATQERRDDWRTIDTGAELLRWQGRSYEPVEK